jgi:single-stranded DNA-binding protein
MAIIAGVVIAAAVSVLAVTVHLRLSAIEGNEGNSNESTSHKINEIISSIGNSNSNKISNSEANESPEQRASEGK